jgi:hypothetical protein
VVIIGNIHDNPDLLKDGVDNDWVKNKRAL